MMYCRVICSAVPFYFFRLPRGGSCKLKADVATPPGGAVEGALAVRWLNPNIPPPPRPPGFPRLPKPSCPMPLPTQIMHTYICIIYIYIYIYQYILAQTMDIPEKANHCVHAGNPLYL